MRLILILTLAAVLAVPASAQAAPQLRLVDQAPVQVAGTGFQRGEKVTVRVAVSSGATFARSVVASSTGRISVRFLGHSITECDGYTLTAAGKAGSRVTKKIAIPPACGIVVSP